MVVVPASIVAPFPSALGTLAELRAPGGGLFASAGDLFREAEFGRDEIQSASDLLELRPELARAVILAIARRQGTQLAPAGPRSSEEEPGKVHHEHRQREISGEIVSTQALRLLESLSQRWGGTSESMTYYGTVDATPLYVRLVDKYCRLHGNAILSQTYVNKDGRVCTLAESVHEAARWVERRIESSQLGLLDWQRRNPNGIEYQTWTDGKTSLIDINGLTLDPDTPIATADVQAWAYDALIGAARLLPGSDGERWKSRAAELRDTALRHFWMTRYRYPALAVTLDADGKVRHINTLSTLSAEVLDSSFFNDLPQGDRETYVSSIVSRVCGPDFLTAGGVRCLAKRYTRVTDYWQYQGPLTTWPKQTYTIIRGLRRQGYNALADVLSIRLINAVNITGDFPEFFYLNRRGVPVYQPVTGAAAEVIAGTNLPDRLQAWTVSAVLAAKSQLDCATSCRPASPGEVRVFDAMPRVTLMSKREIEQVRSHVTPTRIDRELGVRCELDLLRRSGVSARLWQPPRSLAGK